MEQIMAVEIFWKRWKRRISAKLFCSGRHISQFFDKGGMMRQLRERGIYTILSEGEELIAHAVFRGGYVLYTPTDWEFFGPYTYESDWAGNIRCEEKSTRWHLDDLAFTNRIARSRSRSGAALSE